MIIGTDILASCKFHVKLISRHCNSPLPSKKKKCIFAPNCYYHRKRKEKTHTHTQIPNANGTVMSIRGRALFFPISTKLNLNM